MYVCTYVFINVCVYVCMNDVFYLASTHGR